MNSTIFLVCKIVLIVTVIILVRSCFTPKKHLIYQVKYRGNKLKIFAVGHSPFEPSITSGYIQFNQLSEILYLNASRNVIIQYLPQIPTENIVWLHSIKDTNTHFTSLFVDDKAFTKKEFDAFADCLKENYKSITERFLNIRDDEKAIRIHRNSFNIDAVVYGNADRYATVYTSPDQSRSLYIMPDGNCELYALDGKKKKLLPLSDGFYGATWDPSDNTITQWFIDSSKATEVLKGFKDARTGALLVDNYQLLLKPYLIEHPSVSANTTLVYFIVGAHPDPNEFKAHKYLERKYGIVIAYPLSDKQTLASVAIHNPKVLAQLEKKYPELETNSLDNQTRLYIQNVEKWRAILNEKIQLEQLESQAIKNKCTIILDWKKDAQDNEFIEVISYDEQKKSEELIMKYFPKNDSIEK